MTVGTDFQHWAAEYQQRIEARLQAVLPSPEVAPRRLHQAMRYAALGGGKRVRPLLAFAAGEVTRADPGRVAVAGAAVELLGTHYAADGCYARLAAWLARHARNYGFFLPYDVDRGGVQPEPWHLSFAPVAAPAQAALRPELVRAALADGRLAGWNIVSVELARIFERYVTAIASPSQAALAAVALSRAARPA